MELGSLQHSIPYIVAVLYAANLFSTYYNKLIFLLFVFFYSSSKFSLRCCLIKASMNCSFSNSNCEERKSFTSILHFVNYLLLYSLTAIRLHPFVLRLLLLAQLTYAPHPQLLHSLCHARLLSLLRWYIKLLLLPKQMQPIIIRR